MRASKNRCFHLAMVRELSLKLEYKSPAANRKMMRARRAKSARPRPVRARDSRALRSSPVSTMSAVVCGMRHTNIYMSLVQTTRFRGGLVAKSTTQFISEEFLGDFAQKFASKAARRDGATVAPNSTNKLTA